MNRTTPLTGLVILLTLGCGLISPGCNENPQEITIMSWNVENLFDDVNNGTEYREYIPGDEWGAREFHSRMIELTKVIEAANQNGPDILLLQEVENQNVIEVWNERYLKNLGYKTVITTPSQGAITTAVLSKLPVSEVLVHTYELPGYTLGRPICEVRIETAGGQIILMNNHWKSKSGGAEETEPKRMAAAEAIRNRLIEIGDKQIPIILGGDFNEEWDEQLKDINWLTALIDNEASLNLSETDLEQSLIICRIPEENTVVPPQQSLRHLYTPWPLMTGGSYKYNDQWERIDHFFLSAALFDNEGWEWAGTEVFKEEWMLNSWDSPKGWYKETGEGFSDHLPLLLNLKWISSQD